MCKCVFKITSDTSLLIFGYEHGSRIENSNKTLPFNYFCFCMIITSGIDLSPDTGRGLLHPSHSHLPSLKLDEITTYEL